MVDGGLEKLKPWLLNIQARAPGCPVIIVGTHWDELDSQESGEILEALSKNINEMSNKPGMPHIIGAVWVSLAVNTLFLFVCHFVDLFT